MLSILAGIAVGIVCVCRQRTLADPLIDLQLFRVPAFSTSLGMYALAIFVAFGSFFFIGQYLQLVRGLSPLEAGVWFLPSCAGFIAGAMAAPQIVRRVRPALVVGAGLVLGTAALTVRLLRNVRVGDETEVQPDVEAPCPPLHMRSDPQAGD